MRSFMSFEGVSVGVRLPKIMRSVVAPSAQMGHPTDEHGVEGAIVCKFPHPVVLDQPGLLEGPKVVPFGFGLGNLKRGIKRRAVSSVEARGIAEEC